MGCESWRFRSALSSAPPPPSSLCLDEVADPEDRALVSDLAGRGVWLSSPGPSWQTVPVASLTSAPSSTAGGLWPTTTCPLSGRC